MLKLLVRIGEVVEIGDVAAVKVFDRKGRDVYLGFETPIHPIVINHSGIVPERFSTGIVRGQKPRPALAAAAG